MTFLASRRALERNVFGYGQRTQLQFVKFLSHGVLPATDLGTLSCYFKYFIIVSLTKEEAKTTAMPRTPTLLKPGIFSKRTGLTLFARVVSLVTRHLREPYFPSLYDSDFREPRAYRHWQEVNLPWTTNGPSRDFHPLERAHVEHTRKMALLTLRHFFSTL